MSNYTISLNDGIDYTTNWRTEHPNLVKAFKIDKDEIDEIMAIEGAAGMRAYLGYKEEGSDPVLVMVATDANGNDITSTVFDFAEACPSVCDSNSPLNS